MHNTSAALLVANTTPENKKTRTRKATKAKCENPWRLTKEGQLWSRWPQCHTTRETDIPKNRKCLTWKTWKWTPHEPRWTRPPVNERNAMRPRKTSEVPTRRLRSTDRQMDGRTDRQTNYSSTLCQQVFKKILRELPKHRFPCLRNIQLS